MATMNSSKQSPELTAEQQQALDEAGGVVQGQSYILMRTDVVLSYFGFDTKDELRRQLQPAFEQADRGELDEWNVKEFLARMHRQRDAKTE